MTRRDLQGEAKKQGRPWCIGKAFEESAPICTLRPAAECRLDADTEIRLDVNGATRQRSTLGKLIWSVPEVIEHVSKAWTLAMLAADAGVRAGWPALAHAAGLVAGPTHRAAATLGGNLCQDTRCVFYNQSEWWRAGNGYCLKYRGDTCHVVVKNDRCYATYHGDVAPALIALRAEAEIVGPDGRRTIPLASLFQEDGAKRLTLARGEWLAAVELPAPGRWRAVYDKARVRDAVDFPLAGVAVALERDGDRLAGLRVVITGTNSAPLVVPTDSLLGQAWDDNVARALAEAVRATSNVLATTVAPVRYRRRMLQALARKLADALWAASANPSSPSS